MADREAALARRRARRAQKQVENPHGRLLEPPARPDHNRCFAGFRAGHRCALDAGHYRPHTDLHPSPHIAENGTEWFGSSEFLYEYGNAS